MSSRVPHRFRLHHLTWFAVGAVVFLAGCALYARYVEPHWLKIRTVRLGHGKHTLRVCHISDLHYTPADRRYLERVCREIRKLKPDLVCFTGDLADSAALAREALELLVQLGCPVYGVSGNHDIFDRTLYETAFAATGGQWLENQTVALPGGCGTIGGLMRQSITALPVTDPRPRILLVHTPHTVADLHGQRYDLILAGHSHGGQIRLPFVGAFFVPYGLGPYDKGLFHTPVGPLYVNPGLGTFCIPARFLCRPEITLVEFSS
jgi:predicted MPP superfamily phosphohydrolase